MSIKSMVVTPTMMSDLQPSQYYFITVQQATIKINDQLFHLSTNFGVENAIKHAIENYESITISYREWDNLIMGVIRHEKSM